MINYLLLLSIVIICGYLIRCNYVNWYLVKRNLTFRISPKKIFLRFNKLIKFIVIKQAKACYGVIFPTLQLGVFKHNLIKTPSPSRGICGEVGREVGSPEVKDPLRQRENKTLDGSGEGESFCGP